MVRGRLTLLIALARSARADNPAGQPFTDGSFTLTQNDPLTGQSVSRPVWVNVPDGTGPFPVLISCHGNGGQSTQVPNKVIGGVALHDYFAVVAPHGHDNSWNIVAEASKMDDVAFIHAILDKLALHPNIDVSKTIMSGYSNGAALTNRIMIESDDSRIVAGAPEVSQLNDKQYQTGQFRTGTTVAVQEGDHNTYNTVKTALLHRAIFTMLGELDVVIPTCACPSAIDGFGMIADEDSVYHYATAYGYSGSKLTSTSHGSGQDAYWRWDYRDYGVDVQSYTAVEKNHGGISGITEIDDELLLFYSRHGGVTLTSSGGGSSGGDSGGGGGGTGSSSGGSAGVCSVECSDEFTGPCMTAYNSGNTGDDYNSCRYNLDNGVNPIAATCTVPYCTDTPAMAAVNPNPAGQPPSLPPPPSVPPGTATLTAGTHTLDGREFIVHTLPAVTPAPVVIVLHGNGGIAQNDLDDVVQPGCCTPRTYAFVSTHILVAPKGLQYSWNIKGETSKEDDQLYVGTTLVNHLNTFSNVASEFKLWGVSNGAALTNRIFIENDNPLITTGFNDGSQLMTVQYRPNQAGTFYVGGPPGPINAYTTSKANLRSRRMMTVVGGLDTLLPAAGGASGISDGEGGTMTMVPWEDAVLAYATAYGYAGAKGTFSTDDSTLSKVSYLGGQVVGLLYKQGGHITCGDFDCIAQVDEFMAGAPVTSLPPLSPPPLPPVHTPPSAPAATAATVGFTLTASGDVSSYTSAVTDSIATSVADALSGVSASDVAVSVTSGSVLITVAIATTTAASSAVASTLSTHLATPTAATTLVAANLPVGASLTVIDVTTAAAVLDTGGGGDISDSSSSTAGMVGGIVGGISALVIGLLGGLWYCKSKQGGSKVSATAKTEE